MMNQQHISTIRQTHRVATTLLPVLTASLTVAGAVIAAMESRAPEQAQERPEMAGEAAEGAAHGEGMGRATGGRRGAAGRRLTVWGVMATLVGRALLVALGIALVLALVFVASATGRVGLAIMLTALILLSLYLAEKVASNTTRRA